VSLIIRNNMNMRSSLAKTLSAAESSNIAMLVQTPSVFTTWYTIEPDLSEVVKGYRNIDEFIGPESTVIYNKIEHLPMFGIDNLVETATYNDEIVALDEDFQSQGVIYPNTIFPKPHDCFTIETAEVPALYVVTNVEPTTVRSNPFIGITFKLYSRDPNVIAQVGRQVKDEYTTALSSIGRNHSLVMNKKSLETVEEHVKNYLELAYLYDGLFYDRNCAAFVFDGLPNNVTGRRCRYVDMTLWKLMFDEGILIYDDLITYAKSNGIGSTPGKIFTSSPDIYVDEHLYRRSILWRIYDRNTDSPGIRKETFDRYRFPRIFEPSQRITKYQGLDIWFIDNYIDHPSEADKYGDFYIWDDEFIHRIRQNEPYPEFDISADGPCQHCDHHCCGSPVACINPYLRNAVIHWYNGEDIDWSGLQITDAATIENYYLIPLVMGIYKKYIQGLG